MEQAVRKIALLGMGTVGGGVYEIIERQKEEMPFKMRVHTLRRHWKRASML